MARGAIGLAGHMSVTLASGIVAAVRVDETARL